MDFGAHLRCDPLLLPSWQAPRMHAAFESLLQSLSRDSNSPAAQQVSSRSSAWPTVCTKLPHFS